MNDVYLLKISPGRWWLDWWCWNSAAGVVLILRICCRVTQVLNFLLEEWSGPQCEATTICTCTQRESIPRPKTLTDRC